MGLYGIQEDDPVWSFKLLRKESRVLAVWRGYYMKDEKMIELKFKEFRFPEKGGNITGLTTKHQTVEGKINENRRLVFTLEDSKGDKLYFEG